jgi:hypothetical protein
MVGLAFWQYCRFGKERRRCNGLAFDLEFEKEASEHLFRKMAELRSNSYVSQPRVNGKFAKRVK